MMKEECVLFPYTIDIEDAARNRRALPKPPVGTVANPVRMMMLEHEDAGALLGRMRKISGNYTIPLDACISYQTLYRALDAFEKDLHQHIHLENNILFPRAMEMEATVIVSHNASVLGARKAKIMHRRSRGSISQRTLIHRLHFCVYDYLSLSLSAINDGVGPAHCHL
jgi:hypothetical protein